MNCKECTLKFFCLLLCISMAMADFARKENSINKLRKHQRKKDGRLNFPQKKEKRRQSINIGEFADGPPRRQGLRPGRNGDVYEFHRFQHYGFKTPAPSTYSLESMLAFLAPLATIPIIASAALSSMAAVLPALTTEGMVKGRSRREVVSDMLNSTILSSNSSILSSNSSTYLHRDMRDIDIIHKYLRQMNPKEDYNDEVMASYLQCSGMLGTGNHCLERLVCQFSDESSNMKDMEKEVSSLIIYTILNNKFIHLDFKERLRKAAFFGRDKTGKCGLYFCSRNDFKAV